MKQQAVLQAYPKGPIERASALQRLSSHYERIYGARPVVDTAFKHKAAQVSSARSFFRTTAPTPKGTYVRSNSPEVPNLPIAERIQLFLSQVPSCISQQNLQTQVQQQKACNSHHHCCLDNAPKAINKRPTPRIQSRSRVREMRVYHPPRWKIINPPLEELHPPPKSKNKPPPVHTPSLDSAYQGEYSSADSREASRDPTPEQLGIFAATTTTTLTVPELQRTRNTARKAMSSATLAALREKTRKEEEEQPYLDFLTELTGEVLRRGIFTNKGLKQLFHAHVERHQHRLEPEKLTSSVEKLRMQLGIPKDDSLNHLGYGFGSVGTSLGREAADEDEDIVQEDDWSPGDFSATASDVALALADLDLDSNTTKEIMSLLMS